ncbi:glycosyl hydrolase [Marinicrinis sediminis]|uniref:Glycosyl hydrolase n=1 Tax=Marinicrinis sediminis TaxID=1652465 RepID=A0ABW5R9X4_9BACL
MKNWNRKGWMLLLVAIMALSAAGQAVAHTVSLSNSGASVATKDVYNWLAHLPNRTDNRVVSGHFAGYSDDTFSMTQTNNLKNQTNQYAGILSCDYAKGWWTGLNSLTDAISYGCNTELINYWNQGGLVAISMHLPSPDNPNGGGYKTTLSTAKFQNLDNHTTTEGARWKAMMDKIALGLQELENAGVPVLFRPLHEMNGEWFWWGSTGYNQYDANRAQAYKDTWINMYNYLTTTKGLNNLIWVYSADANCNNKTSYYPGDAYVDMTGLDAYIDNPSNLTGYDEMVALGKPFAFAEIGPQTTNGTFDYSQWMTAIKQKFPKAVYFLAWNDAWGPNNNQGASALMNDSWTVNRGEIWNGSTLTPIVEAGSGGGTSATTLYGFEGSTQSWTGLNVSGGPWSVTEWKSEGTHSLKANVTLAGNQKYTLKRTENHNFSGKTTLKARVKHASWGNPGSGMTAKLFVKTGSGWTWQDGGSFSINSSGTTTLTLPISSLSNSGDVKEIGVEFFSPTGSSGSSAIYVDQITIE